MTFEAHWSGVKDSLSFYILRGFRLLFNVFGSYCIVVEITLIPNMCLAFCSLHYFSRKTHVFRGRRAFIIIVRRGALSVVRGGGRAVDVSARRVIVDRG